jgi:HNH endonuclease
VHLQFGDTKLPERFWDKVYPEPNTGCWLWGGAWEGSGYASFRVGRRMMKGHRLTYAAAHGHEPSGDTDHLCRQRPCVNPEHLQDVPHVVNVLRGEGLAAQQARQTHCRRAGHPLSGDNLYVIPSTGARVCRACKSAGRSTARSVGAAYQAGGSQGGPPQRTGRAW